MSSDHYFPWLASQGHAPYAWSVLGAVAQATEEVELFTYVTCPTMRYHPAVVAQKAATLQILADGRFTLGVGSGENLNEHVVGGRWPTVSRRQQMLKEAIQIIRELFTGELIDWKGEYFEVDSARIWDVPETPVAIATAVSGERSVDMFAPLSDHLIAVEPNKDLVDAWHDGRRATGLPGEVRVIGQIPICWDPDRDAAVQRTTSSAGSVAVGPSTPTCRPRQASRAPRSSCGRRTSPTPSRADPTSTRSSTRCASTGKQASPTSHSFRSATKVRSCSSRRQQARCWRNFEPNHTERQRHAAWQGNLRRRKR